MIKIIFMVILMKLCKTIGVFVLEYFDTYLNYSLSNLIIINQKNKNQNFGSFQPFFDFELKAKRSRAEPKILQLELWLEPAWLGLITTSLFS